MIALMYHDIVPAGAEDSSGFPGRDAALYKVTPEAFKAHLAALDRWATVAPRNSRRARHQDASVQANDSPAITFDDGGVSAVYAAEELERHGRRGYFFMTVNYIGRAGFLDASDLRDLHARGHIVGSHSCSHPLRMAHCSASQLQLEWAASRARLSDVLGADVRVASVPGGDYASRVAGAAADAGYTRLFTSEPTTAAETVAGTMVCGRFTVHKWTSARTVAGLAHAAWLPCSRQAALWTAKKVAKRIGGRSYLHVRRLLLGHADEVEWGDAQARIRN